jgi:hypothetical protein
LSLAIKKFQAAQNKGFSRDLLMERSCHVAELNQLIQKASSILYQDKPSEKELLGVSDRCIHKETNSGYTCVGSYDGRREQEVQAICSSNQIFALKNHEHISTASLDDIKAALVSFSQMMSHIKKISQEGW